jgi:hypothetical protein
MFSLSEEILLLPLENNTKSYSSLSHTIDFLGYSEFMTHAITKPWTTCHIKNFMKLENKL